MLSSTFSLLFRSSHLYLFSSSVLSPMSSSPPLSPQFWAKQEAERQAASQTQKTITPSSQGASNLRARFEQAAAAQADVYSPSSSLLPLFPIPLSFFLSPSLLFSSSHYLH